MAYDSESNRLILFGGDAIRDGLLGTVQYDSWETWAFDFTNITWINMNPPFAPPPRYFHAMAYDVESDRVVLFGGGPGNLMDDTWAYDYNRNNWTRMNPSDRPNPRSNHVMAYDALVDRVILAGGRSGTNPYTNLPNEHRDTWFYDFDSDRWTESTVQAPNSLDAAMAVHCRMGLAIVFGGGIPALNLYGSHTWAFNSTTERWQDLLPRNIPPGRVGHAMAYDPSAGLLILFGGDLGTPTRLANDTWVYHDGRNSWLQVFSAAAPTPRKSSAMVYDLGARGGILFGGVAGDGWSFDNETWLFRIAPLSEDVDLGGLLILSGIGMGAAAIAVWLGRRGRERRKRQESSK